MVSDLFSPYGSLLNRPEQTLPSLYIQGYGALFFVQAGFPLEWSAEPVLAVGMEGKDDPSEDPVWQEARDQVLNPAAQANQPRSPRRDTEALMRNLIKAMGHAANIRHMAPEERVVVTILSGSQMPSMYGMMGGPGGMPSDLYGMGYGSAGGAGAGDVYGGGGEGYGAGSSVSTSRRGSRSQRSSGFASASRSGASSMRSKSTVTIEATRAQINAFSKGQIPFDEFVKCVQVTKY